MPGAWVERRATRRGEVRHLVRYRLGGRESVPRYAGSFRTLREAHARMRWVEGELAALRVPDVRAALAAPPSVPTVKDAAAAWQASRVDVAPATAVLHRVALARVLPTLGAIRVDEVTAADVAGLVARLHAAGYARGSIAKSLTALRMVLDHAGRDPNPARDRRVKLPREVREELRPPSAGDLEAALVLVAPRYRVALLVLEATGLRVGELEGLTWADLDERHGRLRVRAAASKSGRSRYAPLPPDLLERVARLVPREDRDPDAALFPGATQARMRTDLGRACRAAGVPRFGLHDLRHRWISLRLHDGMPVHEVARAAGHARASITLDTYAHVLLDLRPIDRRRVLERPS